MNKKSDLDRGARQAIGVTARVHRLCSHRAYKKKLPFRILLRIIYSTAGQNKVSYWMRYHRVHHKYTDAEPHNSNRGFFFSHVGWLMMKKHREVIQKIVKLIYFGMLTLIFCFVLPIVVPIYGWNETWIRSIHIQLFYRYVFGLNGTWSVNSLAHIWGTKPYDARLQAEHHIDFFVKIGWAYDLKQPSQQLVMSVVTKRGDGSHHMWNPISHSDSKIEERKNDSIWEPSRRVFQINSTS